MKSPRALRLCQIFKRDVSACWLKRVANSWPFQTSLFSSPDTHRWDYTSRNSPYCYVNPLVSRTGDRVLLNIARESPPRAGLSGDAMTQENRVCFGFFSLAVAMATTAANKYLLLRKRVRKKRNRYLFKRPFPGAFSDSIFLFFRNFVSPSPRRAADKGTPARQGRAGSPNFRNYNKQVFRARAGQNLSLPPWSLPPPSKSTNASR